MYPCNVQSLFKFATDSYLNIPPHMQLSTELTGLFQEAGSLAMQLSTGLTGLFQEAGSLAMLLSTGLTGLQVVFWLLSVFMLL